jgi:putative Mg2+ transporter-C (MgtC) family protein
MDFPSVLAHFRDVDYAPYLLALLLGGSIGLEREIHGRPAGLRTHILVCLSATMLIAVSRAVESGGLELPEAGRVVFDPNRMGAGIVTGIGFLGAATVIRSGDLLRGLTTAACIWFVAGLGIVLGTGHYAIAVVVTAVVLFVLTVLNQMASRIEPVIYRRLVVRALHTEIEPLVTQVRSELERERVRLLDVASSHERESGETELVFYVSLKNHFQSPGLVERISRLDPVIEARWRQIT